MDNVAGSRRTDARYALRTELGKLDETSWGKGLHVVVPLAPRLGCRNVKAYSQPVVRDMAETIPSRFVAVMGGRNRVGRFVPVDYLGNGHTTARAFLGPDKAKPWYLLAGHLGAMDKLKSEAQRTIATA